MDLKQYKASLTQAIDTRYPRDTINPALLGEHKISFEEALAKIRKEYPYQAVWNCRIRKGKYVFTVDTGPRTEFCLSALDFYVDCTTGEIGFYRGEYSDWFWESENKHVNNDITVWIDLSPEEAYHGDKKTRKLRERLLSASLMQNERI